MLLRMLRRISVIVVISGSGLAVAEPAPHVLLKTVTVDVIEILKQSRGNFSPTRGPQLEELVERKIVPIFDFQRMTAAAMDGNWRLATAPQRTALIAEFRTLLVRTYAVAIRNYRDETFDFSLLSGAGDARNATVRSVVRQGAAIRATIDYDMQNRAEGWKVYEIRLDGINLIANYRHTFAASVRDGGVDGLIQTLTDKNRQSSYSGAGSRAAAPDDPNGSDPLHRLR